MEECREGRVRSVNTSRRKGGRKTPCAGGAAIEANRGVAGDAHAGDWHRQVSLLGIDSVSKLQEKITLKLKAGDFAENILVEGICVYKLPVGTKVSIGSALCEVTQIGKTCHNDCAIRKAAGDCVMPREGIFVRVLESGRVKPGDEISMVEESGE